MALLPTDVILILSSLPHEVLLQYHFHSYVRITLTSEGMLWAEGLTESHLQVLFGHFIFEVVFLFL